jgi:hypothetical protein
MAAPWRIREFHILSDRTLRVRFQDDLAGTVDLSALIDGDRPGIFASLRKPELFQQAYLDNGVITWPGDLDLAPDAMHEQIAQNGICHF